MPPTFESLTGTTYAEAIKRPMKPITQEQIDLIKGTHQITQQERDDAALAEQQSNTPRYQQWLKSKQQYSTYGEPRLAGMIS